VQDKQSKINTANAYASKILPLARGEAARIKAGAEGYRAATIAKADGDARRFEQLVAQYRKAPEVTRKRLYLETMQQVVGQNRKVIAGRGNVLYLPMDGTAPTPGSAASPALPTMPAVKATTAPEPEPERPERGTGREGSN
jgi:membrane protease subunit HflK